MQRTASVGDNEEEPSHRLPVYPFKSFCFCSLFLASPSQAHQIFSSFRMYCNLRIDAKQLHKGGDGGGIIIDPNFACVCENDSYIFFPAARQNQEA